MGWPEFVGIMDASGEGVRGVVISKDSKCVPTVYWMEWPKDIKKDHENSLQLHDGGSYHAVQQQPANGLVGRQNGVKELSDGGTTRARARPAD